MQKYSATKALFVVSTLFCILYADAMEQRVSKKDAKTTTVANWIDKTFSPLGEDEKIILFGYTYLQAQLAQEMSAALAKGATMQVGSEDAWHVLAENKKRIQVFMSILVKENPQAQKIKCAITLQNKQMPLLPVSGDGLEDVLVSIIKARKKFLVAMKPSLPQSDTIASILDRSKSKPLNMAHEKQTCKQEVYEWVDKKFKPLNADAQSVVFGYTYLVIRFAKEFYSSLTKKPADIFDALTNNTQRLKSFMDTQKNDPNLPTIVNVIRHQERHVPTPVVSSKVVSRVEAELAESCASLYGIDAQLVKDCLYGNGLQVYHKKLPNIIDVRLRFLEAMKHAMPHGEKILFVMERIVDSNGKLDKEHIIEEMGNKFK